MNRTPLYHEHRTLGARFMDFGGWELPLQFKGILVEHRAVRETAGIFDISHMGQVWVSGTDAASYLQRLGTNNVASLIPGKGVYNLLCREDGGVVDDFYVFCLEPNRYLLIVNASRTSVDLRWMKDHVAARQRPGLSDGTADVKIIEQPQAAAVALQGPRAEKILKVLFPSAAGMPRNGVGELSCDELEYVISRTGYTGEDGFEIFAPAGHIVPLYGNLLKAGESWGLEPCGLGARDTLRLEMGYRLYGQDMDEQHTALEAGLGWVVKFDKPDFIGKDHLWREKSRGVQRRFIAFRLKERGVARHGHPLLFKERSVGEVTSGTFSPSLEVGIGMGYVDARLFPATAQADAELTVKVHEREIPLETVPLPFYRKEAAKTGKV